MRGVAVLGLLLAVAGVAVLSQMREYQEPTELEDIFASLEKPVTEHAPLPRARDFTSAEFTRPGLWRDSLVQKRHRLEAEKKKLEEKKKRLIDDLQGKRDRAVDKTWRGAIMAHHERLDRSIDYAQRQLRKNLDSAFGQRERQGRRLWEKRNAWALKAAERKERAKELERLLVGYETGHRGGVAVEKAGARAQSVLRSLGTLEEGVEGVQDPQKRLRLTDDVLAVEKAVLG